MDLIDNPDHAERLMARMEASLPIQASIPAALAATLAQNSPNFAAPTKCEIIQLSYSDPGGIICKLDVTTPEDGALFVSITHLKFDRRLPLAREIEIYQRRRIKYFRLTLGMKNSAVIRRSE
jgi:hypothetical protein